MSMIMSLVEVSDSDIAGLLANPVSIWKVVAPEQAAGVIAASGGVSSFDPVVLAEFDLDKAWHILHFLLSGDIGDGEIPAAFLMVGGEEVGDLDVGYGPARAVRADLAGSIASWLAGLSPADVRARFDPSAEALDSVYPSIWDRPDEQASILNWIEESYSRLQAFVAGVAERGNGFVIWLS